MEAINPIVAHAMNTSLTANFKAEWVAWALKQMQPKKALGPDGMPIFFLPTLLIFSRQLCYTYYRHRILYPLQLRPPFPNELEL